MLVNCPDAFNVVENVADLCMLAVIPGKKEDTNASTNNGKSSIPITPGDLNGIAENNFLDTPETAGNIFLLSTVPTLTKFNNINISPKKINPAG